MSEINGVIITGETEKLPPGYAELTDTQKPLPAGVAFFERRVAIREMLKTIAFVVVFAVVGIIVVVFGIMVLFEKDGVQQSASIKLLPLIFGLICLLASWMLAQSLLRSRSLMRSQKNGERTRLGIFLTREAIFQVNETDYRLVPQFHFRGIVGDTVRYLEGGQEKKLRLPQSLVNGDTEMMKAAISQWANDVAAR